MIDKDAVRVKSVDYRDEQPPGRRFELDVTVENSHSMLLSDESDPDICRVSHSEDPLRAGSFGYHVTVTASIFGVDTDRETTCVVQRILLRNGEKTVTLRLTAPENPGNHVIGIAVTGADSMSRVDTVEKELQVTSDVEAESEDDGGLFDLDDRIDDRLDDLDEAGESAEKIARAILIVVLLLAFLFAAGNLFDINVGASS